ncbi:tRNA (adenosine(37)-N6)-threonylcarbamoyltransferase complex ATPase subunit type 1 TsaE [Paenisporosarcina cavernae]|uniref:tRNA threonylcarbamoyladenosine biosynthesis protein TsaE n=1 Tax=Paenisporosarcina cavernae TaxID=2320858 RepID=A0A385YUI4_9BACL|nr:tRNA (adenosine(37)-N6)-threonylcarbamoyltransferase complex ATPase subunit type 1 TsaE [Paenisporosarcina cavernae]AYC30346.1 tRNA (adenosine(37)-N6)-threonylcarbamoyltransferase complex ATPase subunit type 1 TsaE [Paenisporosarcina cavernae]
MEKTIAVHSLEETRTLAMKLAHLVQPQDVITLDGDLGAGKTTFTQFFAKGLGITRIVNSPTFTIMKQYEGKFPFNHLDVYRLEDSVDDLGWDEIFFGDAVTIVEWSSIINSELPQDRLMIHIARVAEEERAFTIRATGERSESLLKELIT